MVDLSDKESQSEEMSSQSDNNNNHTNLKTCVDCGTSKTPLWRGGPAGPKSLCNACGIRSRKKRRALMGGVTKEEKKIKKSGKNSNNSVISNQSSSSNSCTSSSGDSTSKKVVNFSINKKMFDFGGRDVRFQRPRSHRRKLGEEEQAAFLLMALSCGSVYA